MIGREKEQRRLRELADSGEGRSRGIKHTLFHMIKNAKDENASVLRTILQNCASRSRPFATRYWRCSVRDD